MRRARVRKADLQHLLQFKVIAVPECDLSNVVTRHAAPAIRCPVHTIHSTACSVLVAVDKLVGDAGYGAVAVSVGRQQLQ